ncbi:MAG: YebC/PmpR family DNA-binding transcriptional regulator [Clostridiales bacterium]|uniref:Probable transcriptional regulatory protein EDD78_10597 n=1 Tax=Harryflintia acetispora TaxID=1849041 RepID=A0A9X8UJE3_9FIRM|nr:MULTISPECIES: YebC/PmpR family DNA-binding transcriptional regulator [Oscillospiraceae]PWM38165.1 MAG: YebC/PmpR family DNA-binding transcriptional regulator [Clostridiales bacterium]RGB67942.1 YebC/PmpR family DNA-binding transcriptional regulator [Harryflintia acetispora]TCL43467.1 YebC/PmpR family DNA-binding regulatory protein [Harryflintia acetispora]
MSGHSKWSTIKRKKEKTDGARAKVFTKISREIIVAVREGGGDPNNNSKLRDLISKAKSNNIPNDNIDRLIKKAVGDGDKNNYESIVYEGYGPSGVAVMVDALTDNRNRTAGDLRHYFDKFGGNLGQNGCVSFLFERKGLVIVNNEEGGISEEKFMEDLMETPAGDYEFDDDVIEVYTDPDDLSAVREGLEGKGYRLESAEVEYIATTETKLEDEEDVQKMERLLEMLEDNDDVQNVWHSCSNVD